MQCKYDMKSKFWKASKPFSEMDYSCPVLFSITFDMYTLTYRSFQPNPAISQLPALPSKVLPSEYFGQHTSSGSHASLVAPPQPPFPHKPTGDLLVHPNPSVSFPSSHRKHASSRNKLRLISHSQHLRRKDAETGREDGVGNLI